LTAVAAAVAAFEAAALASVRLTAELQMPAVQGIREVMGIRIRDSS